MEALDGKLGEPRGMPPVQAFLEIWYHICSLCIETTPCGAKYSSSRSLAGLNYGDGVLIRGMWAVAAPSRDAMPVCKCIPPYVHWYNCTPESDTLIFQTINIHSTEIQ